MSIQTSPLQRVPGVFRHYRHLLPVMPLAARTWKPRNVDLIVSLSHCVAKSVQVPGGCPMSAIALHPCVMPGKAATPIWKAGAQAHPASGGAGFARMPPRLGPGHRAAGHPLRGDLGDHPRADRSLLRSGQRGHPPPRRYRVLYAGAALGIPRGLLPGRLGAVPYKRVDQAVAACHELGRRLVVIGAGPERTRLEATAGPTVQFLGWQTDEVIRDHYRRCRALLFPGEEDFGIVPVEALACGTPVIALGRGGAAETVDNTIGPLRRALRFVAPGRDPDLGSPGASSRSLPGTPPRRVVLAPPLSQPHPRASGSGHHQRTVRHRSATTPPGSGRLGICGAEETVSSIDPARPLPVRFQRQPA